MRNKVALVTGGSSGIGLATARAFARQGARVVIASRKESSAKNALKVLAKGADVRWHATDVTDGKSVARLIDTVMETHGRLDYAFNNAGSGGRLAAQDNRRISHLHIPVHECRDRRDGAQRRDRQQRFS